MRELANTIQKALIFNRGAPITTDDINAALEGERQTDNPILESNENLLRNYIRREMHSDPNGNFFEALMDRYASIMISEALVATNGNRSKAAKLLGLSRPTLHSKIDKYQLKVRTKVD